MSTLTSMYAYVRTYIWWVGGVGVGVAGIAGVSSWGKLGYCLFVPGWDRKRPREKEMGWIGKDGRMADIRKNQWMNFQSIHFIPAGRYLRYPHDQVT